MAMSKCRECAKDVSSEAKVCPHCGIKTPVKKSGLTTLVVSVLTVIVIVGIMSKMSKMSGTPHTTYAGEAVQVPAMTVEQIESKRREDLRFKTAVAALVAIKDSLNDPSSVEWSKIMVDEKAEVVCVKFRAKNSFGALVIDTLAFVKNKPSKTAEVWNKNCVGQPLYDMKHAVHAL